VLVYWVLQPPYLAIFFFFLKKRKVMSNKSIGKAKQSMARDLAYLINLAGEGIPEYLWRNMAEAGESALDVGARRAARNEGGFSYLNARVCCAADKLLGMCISYCQPEPYSIGKLSDHHDVLRPLILLEAKAPGSWYINALATFEPYRGQGVASLLLGDVEQQATAQGVTQISLIVATENAEAVSLYETSGFHAAAEEPVVDYPGALHGGEWLLMLKNL
jgi:ribosomal protein S18 acetylase RimI-like enzyme